MPALFIMSKIIILCRVIAHNSKFINHLASRVTVAAVALHKITIRYLQVTYRQIL